MKTSNYVIYLHVPDGDEYYLVHGYSGAVDKVSAEVVQYLLDHSDPNHTWHTKDQDLVRESLSGRALGQVSSETIEVLKHRGYLTEMTSSDERRYVERLADLLHQKRLQRQPPAFLVVPVYQCNLRCPYCFEAYTRVDLNKQSLLNNLMTREMADAMFTSIGLILDERAAGRSDWLEKTKKGMDITFYGGEPLMQETLPIVEYIVGKGLDHGYRFSAITNGVDLPHFRHLLGPEKIGFLQITFDGPRDIHDRKRIGPLHRRGTYDRIVENVKLVLDTGTRISIRVHVDWKNVERINELTDDIDRCGLLGHPNFSMYTAAVQGFHIGVDRPQHPFIAVHQVHDVVDQKFPHVSKIENFAITDEGIHSKLRRYIKKQLPGIFSDMEVCAATTGMYVFDPLGRIYSCWDNVGVAGQEVGRYSSDGPVFNSHHGEWLQRSPAYIEECKDCKYVFFHYGGCSAMPLSIKGTIFSPACYDYQDDFIHMGRKFFRQGLENILRQPEPAVNPDGVSLESRFNV